MDMPVCMHETIEKKQLVHLVDKAHQQLYEDSYAI